jgi:hypothetical protein
MQKLVAALALAAVGLAGCGSEAGSNGGGSEFSKLLAKTKAAKYKVTYQSSGDEAFTVAQDPPRFSYVSGGDSTFVLADGSTVSCTGTGPSATCTDESGVGDSIKQWLTTRLGAIGTLFVTEAAQGILGLGAIKTTKKSIVGRDAACATIDGGVLGDLGAAIKGSASVCIDEGTGVILATKADDGNGHVADVRAIRFGTPTEADFTPPATPTTSSTTSTTIPVS